VETLIVVLGVFLGLQSAPEVARALKLRNAQVSGRTFEWLQYKAGAMNKESWETYRGVISFVFGTERARALRGLTSGYFNPGFTEMVAGMITDMPPVDYWDQLQDIK